jgi:hypothetical protein
VHHWSDGSNCKYYVRQSGPPSFIKVASMDLPNPVVDSAVDCIFCHSINADFIMLCGQPSASKLILISPLHARRSTHRGTMVIYVEVGQGRSCSNGWLGGRMERNIAGGFPSNTEWFYLCIDAWPLVRDVESIGSTGGFCKTNLAKCEWL